jgi:DNA end-binding protein Ku
MIGAEEGGLMLYKLRQPNQLRKMADVPQLERKDLNKDELKLSINLVESMASSIKEMDLADRYSDALREMIEAKIAGKQIIAAPEEAKPVVDIMTALKQSIEQAKAKRKPMERAKGEAKTVAVAAAQTKPARQPKKKAA